MSEATRKKVVAILAAHWWRHPAACDTPEGIHRWWLGDHRDISLAAVEEALQKMVERELVEQRLLGDRSLYRLRADADASLLQELAMPTLPT